MSDAMSWTSDTRPRPSLRIERTADGDVSLDVDEGWSDMEMVKWLAVSVLATEDREEQR